jgi:hypothetical protein
MSKPDPLEFELTSWSISYKKPEFMGDRKFNVKIIWGATIPDAVHRNSTETLGHREDFGSDNYDDVEKWLVEQTGIKL